MSFSLACEPTPLCRTYLLSQVLACLPFMENISHITSIGRMSFMQNTSPIITIGRMSFMQNTSPIITIGRTVIYAEHISYHYYWPDCHLCRTHLLSLLLAWLSFMQNTSPIITIGLTVICVEHIVHHKLFQCSWAFNFMLIWNAYSIKTVWSFLNIIWHRVLLSLNTSPNIKYLHCTHAQWTYLHI